MYFSWDLQLQWIPYHFPIHSKQTLHSYPLSKDISEETLYIKWTTLRSYWIFPCGALCHPTFNVQRLLISIISNVTLEQAQHILQLFHWATMQQFQYLLWISVPPTAYTLLTKGNTCSPFCAFMPDPERTPDRYSP